MDKVDQIFEQLDDWRHLPTYQLERRADIFFSLYLPNILKASTGIEINDIVIPEFPLHKKTLNKTGNNQSFHADYFAVSKDGNSAFLVELKTDDRSGRTAQDDYLKLAKDARLPALLEGVKAITEKTSSKRKYFCLLKKLEALGLMSNLQKLEGVMNPGRLIGFKKALANVKPSPAARSLSLVCIQPAVVKQKLPYDHVISLQDVRKVVSRHKDPISMRFAESLKAWETPAGE